VNGGRDIISLVLAVWILKQYHHPEGKTSKQSEVCAGPGPGLGVQDEK